MVTYDMCLNAPVPGEQLQVSPLFLLCSLAPFLPGNWKHGQVVLVPTLLSGSVFSGNSFNVTGPQLPEMYSEAKLGPRVPSKLFATIQLLIFVASSLIHSCCHSSFPQLRNPLLAKGGQARSMCPQQKSTSLSVSLEWGGVGMMIIWFTSKVMFSIVAALGGEGYDYLLAICQDCHLTNWRQGL